MEKKCSLCGEIKVWDSQYFYRNKAKKSGLDSECKICANKRRNERRKRPGWKEKELQWNREWRKNNPEKYRLMVQNHYKNHRERILQYRKNFSMEKSGNGLLKLRFEILQRDNFTCQYCGRKAPEVILQVDHIFPKSKGGKIFDKNNLITACSDCNYGKHDIVLDSKRNLK